MSILSVDTPPNGLAILSRGLAAVGIKVNAVAFDTRMRRSPIRVAVLGLDRVARGNVTPYCEMWRYFFTVNSNLMFADIDLKEEDGSLQFNSVAEGEGAELYLRGIEEAFSFGRGADDQFALNMVEVPALHEIAICMAGLQRDYAIEVIELGEFVGFPRKPYREFVAELTIAAEQYEADASYDRGQVDDKGYDG
ncbi:hypothetical protein C8J31_11677 [Rhizobium sp. PP-CC-2G-626]|nr:hypothetical protein C8J31_11677 [Rhizobium sp. PP-CC-2G-626]